MSEETISGVCPHCANSTRFRELTLAENISGVADFVGGFLAGGFGTKAKHATALINGDTRTFPNYKCGSCGGEVMQCSSCKEIIPYAHDGRDHVCGANKAKLKATSGSSNDSSDVISQLERLAVLKEKGLLSDSEFEQQKKKLFG